MARLLSALPAVISEYSSCSRCRMVRRRFSEREPKIMVVELDPGWEEGKRKLNLRNHFLLD